MAMRGLVSHGPFVPSRHFCVRGGVGMPFLRETSPVEQETGLQFPGHRIVAAAAAADTKFQCYLAYRLRTSRVQAAY